MSDEETSVKRRKVRKGTHSCWECKRRKVRCIFPSSEDSTCIGCQRRRVPCVSQELPEALSPTRKGNRHLGERIARVEDIVKDLFAVTDGGAANRAARQPPQDTQCPFADKQQTSSYDPTSSRSVVPPIPAETVAGFTRYPSLVVPEFLDSPRLVEHHTVSFHPLLNGILESGDAKILLQESPRTSRYTMLIHTQRHSKLTHDTLAAPYPPIYIPGTETHPIVLAQFMLIFAITLQSPCGEEFHGLSEPPNVLSRRYVMAAMGWVNTREEVYGTLENLICTMLEGAFEVNCGNLRRAWAIYRRAMTTAQMMGLHRSSKPPLKRIDSTLNVDLEFVWFRIVYMDRYLSLLLGLPQGTTDKSMGTLSILENEPPLGQFERLLTVVASSILERNETASAMKDMRTTTLSIDVELLRISKSMPTSFWRPLNFKNLVPGSPQTLLETVRLAAQVYYFGLLIQLHLPYMMCGKGDKNEHEYSRITCVNAGREIMTRFVAHRTFNPKTACSRPVDFFTLLAAMTLLLAHLDGHRHQETTNFLAHQRLSDRALLEQALDRMDTISDVNKDTFVQKSAKLIRRLLDIEANAAQGSNYTTNTLAEHADDAENSIEDDGGELNLHIPYLGAIKITRQGPIYQEPILIEEQQQHSNLPGVAQGSPFSIGLLSSTQMNTQLQRHEQNDKSAPQYFSRAESDDTIQPQLELPSIAAGIDDWTFQGVDMAFFDSLMKGTSFTGSPRSEQ